MTIAPKTLVGLAAATSLLISVPVASQATTKKATPCTAKIGFMGPFTGPAASIGQEQLNWGKLAIADFNKAKGTKFSIVETDTELDPAKATTGAQRLVSNKSVVAVLGPAGSQEVEAVGPAMTAAKLAFVSPSATRTSLTNGKIPTFVRVVPNDDAQGPTIANFANKLGIKKVLIVDDQTSYSTGLADSATARFKTLNIAVSRESIAQSATDFSSLVSKVTDDTGAVFLPWQLAANAQQFGSQLKEQGKKAVIIGSDGLYSPTDFNLEGAYVASFAPDVRGVASANTVVAAYQKAYDDKFGTFGPPVYVAAQVLATAIQSTCKSGKPGTRAAVTAAVKSTKLASTILGGPVSFDANGDVNDAQFYLFKITGKKYNLIAG